MAAKVIQFDRSQSGPVRSRGPETRVRALRSAQALIAEHGIRQVKMTDISSHAGLAERTLYNLFSTKNDLISELVAEYQRDLFQRFGRDRIADFDDIKRSIRAIALELAANRRWAEAIAHLYFQPDVSLELYRSLHALGLRHFDMAIDMMPDGVDIRQTGLCGLLRHQFANSGFALLHDLAMGRIDGPELGRQLCAALEAGIAALAGARTGEERENDGRGA